MLSDLFLWRTNTGIFFYSSIYESVIVNLEQIVIHHQAFLGQINSLRGLNGRTNSV